MIRVLVVDDHPGVLFSLADYLAGLDDMDVVAQARDGSEAVELCERLRPDVILMDIRMSVMDGIEATRLIKARCAEVAVLLLAAYENSEVLTLAEEAGADGVAAKGAAGTVIAARIRTVLR